MGPLAVIIDVYTVHVFVRSLSNLSVPGLDDLRFHAGVHCVRQVVSVPACTALQVELPTVSGKCREKWGCLPEDFNVVHFGYLRRSTCGHICASIRTNSRLFSEFWEKYTFFWASW